jgi:HAD superfamily hydrolase (TIGR01490 family)
MEAAFFDLDKTVIAKAAMLAFGRPLHRAGYISRWLVLRAVGGQLVFRYFGADEKRMEKMRTASLRIAKGWEQDKVSALVRETLTEVIEPIVFAEALELMREHREAGRYVCIVSSSPTEIVEPLAQYLGADEAVATRPEIDAEGRYTGAVEFYAYGPHKAEAMASVAKRLGIDLRASYAYSDSITDLPMLEAVGHPVAVNPDRELRRVAVRRGWEIRRFDHPVPLRSRVTAPSRSRVLTTAGSTLGFVVLAAAGWRWRRRRERRRATGWRSRMPGCPRVRPSGPSSRPARAGRRG